MLVELYKRVVGGTWMNGALDNQYRIEMVDGVAEVTFMGSVSWVDWISNFMFWKRPYRDMPVKWYAHAGFLESWKALKDEIVDGLRGCRCVRVYGYSRGAAIAVLAYEWFRFNGYEVEGVVFGCPRVLAFRRGSEVADRFATLTVYQNKGDIVTHVPFRWMGYKHVGHVVTLSPLERRMWRAYWHLIPQYQKELEVLDNAATK